MQRLQVEATPNTFADFTARKPPHRYTEIPKQVVFVRQKRSSRRANFGTRKHVEQTPFAQQGGPGANGVCSTKKGHLAEKIRGKKYVEQTPFAPCYRLLSVLANTICSENGQKDTQCDIALVNLEALHIVASWRSLDIINAQTLSDTKSTMQNDTQYVASETPEKLIDLN